MSTYTHLAAANAADADYFLNSVNMQATAYTLDETTPTTSGARHVTVTHTSGDTTDTLGTRVVTGTDLSGQVITETLTLSADATVTGTRWFRTVTGAITSGWVIDGSEATEDTITIGYAADICVLDGPGRLEAIIVNTTAAGTIVVADSSGTIATLKSSITEGHYEYDLTVCNLTVDLNANSDVTIIHSNSMPHTYA